LLLAFDAYFSVLSLYYSISIEPILYTTLKPAIELHSTLTMSAPPPLPARPRSPPPYSTSASGSSTLIGLGYAAKDQWLAAPDPRSSSAQSLRSTVSANDQRRTLLLVYIHGFYGNKQSFRSFPHHVHLYLKSALADSHVIHSKIYPRYKTYRAIEVARDNFSEWLIPHESPTTDVILIGHSMGGILAAEVALMVRNQALNMKCLLYIPF
jgi:pimeloyl-ACP methyl ester carboxylesterase